MNSKLLTLTSRQEYLLEQAFAKGALKRPEPQLTMPGRPRRLGNWQLYLNDCAALTAKGLACKSGTLTRLGKIISAGLFYGSETLNKKGQP